MGSLQSPATLSDVAMLAGVSLKTASRVFNDQPNVSDAVRQRVRAASETLVYAPNTIARELRAGARSTCIGLVIGNLVNPFYSRLAAGLGSVFANAGLELLIASSGDEPDHERELIASMTSRRVQGLVLVPSAEDYSFLTPMMGRGMRVVSVDRPAGGISASSVVIDNRDGVRQAVRHLYAHGHRRIALLADNRALWTARERLDAFTDVCSELGLSAGTAMTIDGLSGMVEARRATVDLVLGREAPTGLVAGNNVIALGVIEGLRRTGRTVALVSFDDFDASELLDVTTLSHDPQEIGVAAARALVADLDDGSGQRMPRSLVVSTSVIARGSGEIPPA
jgi:LacI family transcriptional regulator